MTDEIRRLTTERNEAIADAVNMRRDRDAYIQQLQDERGRCNVAQNENRYLREQVEKYAQVAKDLEARISKLEAAR